MTAVAKSSTAMAAVVASVEAVYAIFNNPAASAIMLAEQSAADAYAKAATTVVGPAVAKLAGQDPAVYTDMAKIAASQVAMAAVRASNTAMTALEASTTAYNALLASSLITRYNPANENTWRTDTVYSGSGILVRLVSFQASGNWYKLDGGAQVTLSGKDNKVVKAFNTKLEAYWVDYQEDARGVYYIKC